MWHEDEVFHILAAGSWVELGKPCCMHICSSVVMDSWMANCNIIAVRTSPETKPTVHKNTCFLGMSFMFVEVAELLHATSIQSRFVILMVLSV